MTKSTSGGCDQFETSPEANDQELRTAFCERRQTDRLKTNYRIDVDICIFNLQSFRPEKASAVLGVCVTCIVGACGSVSVYLQHCDL